MPKLWLNCPLLDIEELLLLIFSYLSMEDAISVNHACAAWYKLLDEKYWKNACRICNYDDKRLETLRNAVAPQPVNKYNRHKMKKTVDLKTINWKREAIEACGRYKKDQIQRVVKGRNIFCLALSAQSPPTKARLCSHAAERIVFVREFVTPSKEHEFRCDACDTNCVINSKPFRVKTKMPDGRVNSACSLVYFNGIMCETIFTYNKSEKTNVSRALNKS
jgi:hypothetical protein